MTREFTLPNMVTETREDGVEIRSYSLVNSNIHGQLMRKRLFTDPNCRLSYRARYGPLHAPPLLEHRSCRDILLTVTDLYMRDMRARHCRLAVISLMKCLLHKPATPRDVDLLLAQTLWNTRRQEEWDWQRRE
jgi:hypothetical protein